MDGQDFGQIREKRNTIPKEEVKVLAKKNRRIGEFILIALIITTSALGVYFLYENYLQNSRNLVWTLPSSQ